MNWNSRRMLGLATAAYAALLLLVSLLPGGGSAPMGWDRDISPQTQNVMHVPAYALAAMMGCGLAGRRTVGRAVLVALACGAFGGLMELAQSMIPGRMGSVGDGLLNLMGAAAGCLAMLGWRRLRPAPAPRPAEET